MPGFLVMEHVADQPPDPTRASLEVNTLVLGSPAMRSERSLPVSLDVSFAWKADILSVPVGGHSIRYDDLEPGTRPVRRQNELVTDPAPVLPGPAFHTVGGQLAGSKRPTFYKQAMVFAADGEFVRSVSVDAGKLVDGPSSDAFVHREGAHGTLRLRSFRQSRRVPHHAGANQQREGCDADSTHRRHYSGLKVTLIRLHDGPE